jgi:hypothetical protein
MPKVGEIDTSYPTLLETENKIQLLEPFTGAKNYHQMKCLVCNHIWSSTPISKRQTFKKYGVSGCPVCNKKSKEIKYKALRDNILSQLRNAGLEILSDYDGSQTTTQLVTFKNIHCGHVFDTYPGNLIQFESKCTVCGKQKRTKKITAWSKANSEKWKKTASAWHIYKSEVAKLTEQTYKMYKETINPKNLPRGKAGVPGAYHLDHIVPKRFCFDNNIPAEICANKSNLQMIEWHENVGIRNHIKGMIPPLFFSYITSNTKLEQYACQLKNILPNAQLFVNIADIMVTAYDQQSNYAIIVLPIDQSHADLKSGYVAYKALTAANVNFIILFEDELTNIPLLFAKLKHYTHSNQSARIHARQCVIKKCSKKEKKQLLDLNHIQGNDNSQLAYGAYYQDKLVAVMTFSRPRIALGQKNKHHDEGKWELSRFCTDVQYKIPGIASKLLTYFKRNNYWTEIYSYADKRWSTGKMYYKLGFRLATDNPPDYFYVINGIRKHRWNYRKDILKRTLVNYDPSLTEYQNMQRCGFYRVWDCGTFKFVMQT